jgi:hypothetical protein
MVGRMIAGDAGSVALRGSHLCGPVALTPRASCGVEQFVVLWRGEVLTGGGGVGV